jgi:hypothetical protein
LEPKGSEPHLLASSSAAMNRVPLHVEKTGVQMADQRNDDPDGAQLQRYLEALEGGAFTTDFTRLTRAGLELPHPVVLNDEQLARKLWEVIHALARMRVFITSTDHLSDRELYIRLWTDTLHHDVPEEDFGLGTSHVDLVSTGSEEGVAAWLKYYADDETRRKWVEDFPDVVLPARQECPYDRDHHMPQPHDELDGVH